MQETSKKPALRFAGFNDAWEQREFGETFDFLTNNTLSRAELNDETGSVLNVHYGDILVKFGEIIDTETDHLPHISDVTKVVRPAFLMDGDVIIADTAEDNTVGKCAEIIGIADKLVVSGLHTIPCRPRRQFAQGYLGYFMNSPAFHDQLLPLMQGTKVASVSKSAMADTLICYPADVTEQAFIGQYFMKLDNLITLHQRKYTKLMNIKKSMLDKMFPKDGASVPEIRFAGFTDAWEQRKVGDILSDVERPIAMLDDETYQLVTVKRRNEGIVSRGYLKGKDILVKNYYRIHAGDFLISKRQVIHGANGYVPKSLDNAVVSNEYMVAVSNNDISTAFWALMSQRKEMYQMYLFSSYGVDVEKMVFNVDDWKKRSVIIPKLEEQTVIVSFFSKLDNLITLHQRELERLQNIKKSCLEKMFV